jgi:hypothetical protein
VIALKTEAAASILGGGGLLLADTELREYFACIYKVSDVYY